MVDAPQNGIADMIAQAKAGDPEQADHSRHHSRTSIWIMPADCGPFWPTARRR